MYIAQVVFSLGSMYALYWFAKRFTNDRLIALGATAVLAISTGAIRTETDLITEPLGSFLLLVAAGVLGFALIDPKGREHTFRWSLVAGTLLGLSIMTRPDFLLQPGVWALVVLIVWRESWRKKFEVVGALAITVFIVMAPYCFWASNKANQLVTPTTSGATTYWVGTYLPGGGTTDGAKAQLKPEIYRRVPSVRNEKNPGADSMILMLRRRHPDIAKRDDAIRLELRKNIRKYAFGQPVAFSRMMAKKPWLMWRQPYKGHAYERSWWGNTLHIPTFIGAIIAVLGFFWLRRKNFMVALVGSTLIVGTAIASIGPAIPRANARYAPLALLGAALVVAAFIEWRKQRGEQQAAKPS
jgi:4-amino-4-deoxy-L-arabinose transferase-like glycosyltransferase